MSKKIKKEVKKDQYIVTWDNNDGDPVKVFTDIEKAKAFVSALITSDQDKVEDFQSPDEYIDVDNVKKDSIKLYKGVLLGKAKVEVTFIEK